MNAVWVVSLMRRMRSVVGRSWWSIRCRCANAKALRQARSVRLLPGSHLEPLRVAYLHPGFPAAPNPSAIGGGGGVKYLWLHDRFPHSVPECHVVYAVSSALHPQAGALLREIRQRGVPVVWNQNGAYFPHSYGADIAAQGNRAMAPLLHDADYVFYQSEFARCSSDHFLGTRSGPAEVLPNAIDTNYLHPMEELHEKGTVLLAAGSHDDEYRLPLVLDTFGCVRKHIANLRLIVAGRIRAEQRRAIQQRIDREGWCDCVELAGPYSPSETPRLFNRAHIFLHVTYSDVCPSVVLEAMACGLPIAFSATGGTPELVGDAGIGVSTVHDWEAPQFPTAEALANAVIRLAEHRQQFSVRARQRAVDKFDIQPWLERHEAVFREWAERSVL